MGAKTLRGAPGLGGAPIPANRGARDIAALIAFFDSRHAMPHDWGSAANDCISFADGAVIAQTGESALGGLIWSNKTGALRILKRLGGMQAALDARFERVPVALAKRGDIAGVPVETILGLDADESALIGLHPMIVEGATLACPGERGLTRAPRRLATVAWDVGMRKGEEFSVPGPSEPTGAGNV